MSDETVVRDEVSRLGQHFLEVMRMGQPVEMSNWVDRVPGAALLLAKSIRRKEAKLNIHRLYICWPAREMVRLDDKLKAGVGCEEVMLWYVEKGKTVREAAAIAAVAMFNQRARWPGKLWLRQVPTEAPAQLQLTCTNGEQTAQVELTVGCLEWIPKSYLVMA